MSNKQEVLVTLSSLRQALLLNDREYGLKYTDKLAGLVRGLETVEDIQETLQELHKNTGWQASISLNHAGAFNILVNGEVQKTSFSPEDRSIVGVIHSVIDAYGPPDPAEVRPGERVPLVNGQNTATIWPNETNFVGVIHVEHDYGQAIRGLWDHDGIFLDYDDFGWNIDWQAWRKEQEELKYDWTKG